MSLLDSILEIREDAYRRENHKVLFSLLQGVFPDGINSAKHELDMLLLIKDPEQRRAICAEIASVIPETWGVDIRFIIKRTVSEVSEQLFVKNIKGNKICH